jgi:hypothetical protein
MIDSGFLLENLDHDASSKLIDQKIAEYKAILEALAK